MDKVKEFTGNSKLEVKKEREKYRKNTKKVAQILFVKRNRTANVHWQSIS